MSILHLDDVIKVHVGDRYRYEALNTSMAWCLLLSPQSFKWYMLIFEIQWYWRICVLEVGFLSRGKDLRIMPYCAAVSGVTRVFLNHLVGLQGRWIYEHMCRKTAQVISVLWVKHGVVYNTPFGSHMIPTVRRRKDTAVSVGSELRSYGTRAFVHVMQFSCRKAERLYQLSARRSC